MRILQYSNRKMEPIAWDASTPELEAAAFLGLFRYLDGDYWRMYAPSPVTGQQKPLYVRARASDAAAARKLLEIRKAAGYEYEDGWQFVEVDLDNGWEKSKMENAFRQRELELKD